MAIENVDVVVVGAGPAGIVATKTYLQIQPDVNIVILEASPTIGGTWAKHRIYPGLRTNNVVGQYEFSDLPMAAMPGVELGQHIPGRTVHEYLKRYADMFDVTRRIRFDAKVATVERVEQKWRVTTDSSIVFLCDKLIVGTGLTSEPFIPTISGADIFQAPVIHARDLAEHSGRLLASKTSITIYGGRKSAQDAVYYFATKGLKVHWVIRESGTGPSMLASTKPIFPGVEYDQPLTMRVMSWMSPCIWGDADGHTWLRWMLHKTTLGAKIIGALWTALSDKVQGESDYDSHPNLQKLKPRYKMFWTGTSLGALNYPTNFYDVVKSDNVQVHSAEIVRLSPNTIHLSSGEQFSTDALICCTGWQDSPPLKFLPDGIDATLGLPSQTTLYDDLARRADAEILRTFPLLATQPIKSGESRAIAKSQGSLGPFRLYRFIAPPTDAFDRSIVFIGMLLSPPICISTELQSLWAVAYLTDKLQNIAQSDEERRWETVLWSQFGMWRSPAGQGHRHPDWVFDTMPYHDVLLRDLGLRFKRKGSWLKEWLTPYGAKDYKGVVDEWIGKHEKVRES